MRISSIWWLPAAVLVLGGCFVIPPGAHHAPRAPRAAAGTMPNLRNKSEAQARRTLGRLGITNIEVKRVPTRGRYGIVHAQRPRRGQPLPSPGEPVVLTLMVRDPTLPPPGTMIRVPDVVGMHKLKAGSVLRKLGFKVPLLTRGRGNVVRQKPPAGTMLAVESHVKIYGEPPRDVVVPDVVGMTYFKAMTTLSKLRLRIDSRSRRGRGRIVTQRPAAGATVKDSVYLKLTYDQ